MFKITPDSIKLVGFTEEAAGARHYRFCLSDPFVHEHWQQAAAGQFFLLCLPEAGEAAFTFTRLPDANGEFSALVRPVGSVTQSLFGRKPCEIIGARGPFGIGWPQQALYEKRVLVVAGGCGIAPLCSVIERQIEQETHAAMAVIFGARNPATILLAAEQERWSEAIDLYQVIENAEGDSCQMEGTPLDALPHAIAQMGGVPEISLICGPEGMMTAVADDLVRRGIPANSIYLSMERRMHCGIGLCGHCYINDKYACTDGPVFRYSGT